MIICVPFINENKNFWFRTRRVSAFSTALSDLHPHIFDLRIRPSIVANLIGSCVRLLPAFAQSWVQATFPEWFLPGHVVLKKQKKGEEETFMDELFDTEVKAYGRLKPLQGIVIPTCYGHLRYDGTRALLLEYLEGVLLSSPEGATLRVEELSTLLQPCYRALHSFGVHPDDNNLSNFQLADGKIKVLDLESVEFDLPADKQIQPEGTDIWDIVYKYRNMQAYHWHNGSLEVA